MTWLIDTVELQLQNSFFSNWTDRLWPHAWVFIELWKWSLFPVVCLKVTARTLWSWQSGKLFQVFKLTITPNVASRFFFLLLHFQSLSPSFWPHFSYWSYYIGGYHQHIIQAVLFFLSISDFKHGETDREASKQTAMYTPFKKRVPMLCVVSVSRSHFLLLFKWVPISVWVAVGRGLREEEEEEEEEKKKKKKKKKLF